MAMAEKSNILIVDDELGPRESLRMILKPYYEVFVAADGKSALETIYNNPIDLVTLDLKMPGMNGIEILKSIKRHDPRIEVLIVTGYGTLKSAVESIRYGVIDYISKPFNVLEILLAIEKGMERSSLNSFFQEKMTELQDQEKVEDSWPSLLNEADTQILQNVRPKFGKDGKYLEFLKVLACTLECKDQYTHGHSGRVTYYAILIGDRIKISDEQKDQLQLASFLHDIGKLGVSNSLVGKEDRLDEREWTLIKEHPERGVGLIEPLDIPGEILDIIRHHHERYDGLGYPYGLGGQEIPLGARIVAMADAYDAMSSDRPYRQALSPEAIREEILRCSGAHFDPDLVKAFVPILEEEDLAKYCATSALPGGIDILGGYEQ